MPTRTALAPAGIFHETARYSIGATDRIVWEGAEYSWAETTERGHILRAPGIATPRLVEHETFAALLDTGKIRFDRGYWSPRQVRRRERGIASHDDLTDEQREQMMHRLRWVEAFESLYVAKKALKSPDGYRDALVVIKDLFETEREAASRYADGRNGHGDRPAEGWTTPSWSQLGRWVRAYAASDGDPLVLVPMRRRSGHRKSRYGGTVRRIIDRFAALYCTPNRPTVALLHERMARMIRRYNRFYGTSYRIPSVKMLERAVTALPDFDKMAGRHGIDHARRYFQPVYSGPVVSRPMERIEIDEWKVSLHTLLETAGRYARMDEKEKEAVKRIRCWLSVAIDVATRCIVGISLSSRDPNHDSALSVLRHVLEDKEDLRRRAGARTEWPCRGWPAGVVTDKGSGFKSHEFRRALDSLDIESMRPPAGRPHFRGTIERFFGNVETRLLPRFDGRAFSNVTEKGDYEADRYAALTIAELERALIRYICDVYHRTPHSGLFGLSPAQAWNRLSRENPPTPPPGDDRMRIAFGTRLKRKISARGVRVLGRFYLSEELSALFRQDRHAEVDVFIDETELGRVSFARASGDDATSRIVVTTGANADRQWFGAQSVDRSVLGRNFEQFGKSAAQHFGLEGTAFSRAAHPDENRRVLDEALRDIDAIASNARRRGAIFFEEKHAAGLKRLKKEIGSAFANNFGHRVREVRSEQALAVVPGDTRGPAPRQAPTVRKNTIEPDVAPAANIGTTAVANDAAPDPEIRNERPAPVRTTETTAKPSGRQPRKWES